MEDDNFLAHDLWQEQELSSTRAQYEKCEVAVIDQKDGSIVHSKVKALMISLPLTSPEKKVTSQSKGGLILEVI